MPRKILIYTLLVCLAVLMGTPLAWMVLSSVKPNSDLFSYPPVWLPSRITLEHYQHAFRAAPFARYFANSTLISTATVIVNCLFCSLAGYAFAKYEFRGRDLLFYALISTMMIPFHVILIPVFIIAKRFPLAGGNNIFGAGGIGLLDSYPGLMLIHLMNAFGVFLMRQFFFSIPDDLLDSARIDGASEFGIYWKIVMPLAKPALGTLAIFTFTGVWDDFLWPLVVITSEDMRTVQLGLQVFQSQYSIQWGPLMAATFAVTLPLILVFVMGQRHFVEGIATSGMKN